jgi:hypothetical protein
VTFTNQKNITKNRCKRKKRRLPPYCCRAVSRDAMRRWALNLINSKGDLEIGETIVNAKKGGLIAFCLLLCFLGVAGLVSAVSFEHPLQGLLVLLSLTSFAVAWGITRINKD